MTSEIAKRDDAPAMLEKVLLEGDLSKLSPKERLNYYQRVCETLGLNPLTKPFNYLVLSGKLTLYANNDCAKQLAARHKVSLTRVGKDTVEGVYMVTYRAMGPDGRSVDNVGAVTIGGLKGDALANALMKTETKAQRRATLAYVGLGWLDETEIETIQNAAIVEVDQATGEIVGELPQPGSEYGTCPTHGEPYFKRGNMRSPAHKDANDKWCNKSEDAVRAPAEASQKPPQQSSGPAPTDLSGAAWQWFYGKCKSLGKEQADVYRAIGSDSAKEYVEQQGWGLMDLLAYCEEQWQFEEMNAAELDRDLAEEA